MRRIKERIKLIENAFKGDKAANTALKELRKAEKLFSDALAASGEKYLRRAYMERRDKRALQEDGGVQFSYSGDVVTMHESEVETDENGNYLAIK